MCEVVMREQLVEGGVAVNLTCKKTGKPLTVSTRFGMFCEEMCDFQEEVESLKGLFEFIKECDESDSLSEIVKYVEQKMKS